MTTGVLVALTGSDAEPAVLARLQTFGASLHVARRCMDVADLLASATTTKAGAVVLAPEFHGLDADVVARLRAAALVVIGVVDELASPAHASLRGLGVGEVITAAEIDDLESYVAAAIIAGRDGRDRDDQVSGYEHDAGAAAAPFGERARRGRVLAVWGPTGAPGRSTVALGLADALAALGAPTLLVDADVYGGSIAQQLGMLDESSGLLAATRAANAGDLTITGLSGHARPVHDLLRVLTGLPRADRWTELRPTLLAAVLDVARTWAAYTVVDCGFSIELDEEVSYDTAVPRRNGATLEVLGSADDVVVVGAADPVGITRLARALADLDTVVKPRSVRVVVNHHRPSLGWSTDDLHEILSRFVSVGTIVTLPRDSSACDKALVHGKLLRECAPGARLTEALAQLGRSTTGVPTSMKRARRNAHRWLRRRTTATDQ